MTPTTSYTAPEPVPAPCPRVSPPFAELDAASDAGFVDVEPLSAGLGPDADARDEPDAEGAGCVPFDEDAVGDALVAECDASDEVPQAAVPARSAAAPRLVTAPRIVVIVVTRVSVDVGTDNAARSGRRRPSLRRSLTRSPTPPGSTNVAENRRCGRGSAVRG